MKRNLTVVAVSLVVIAAVVSYPLLKRRLDRDDCQMCSLAMGLKCISYTCENAGWYATDERGEYTALSKHLCGDTDTVSAEFFATYGTAARQGKYFEEHGELSGDLCPYRYVQGLRDSDSGELVVLYRKNKTRWRGHDFWKGYESESRWLVASPMSIGAHIGMVDDGWLTDEAFANRLEKTLQFLEKEKRPYWEQTIKEHRPFLEKLRREIADADTDTQSGKEK